MNAPFRADEIQAQQRVQRKLAELEGKDLWGILGVAASADPADVKRAYFELAREWHVDSFAGVRLGPAEGALQTLFAKIAEAYEVLSDPHKRAEYEAGKAMQAAGMSTDISALLDAESEFTKARTLLQRGEVKASAKLFAHCYEVNPANVEWRGHHLFANWWVARDLSQATATAAELEKLHKSAPHLNDLLYFSGRLFLEAGELDGAHRAFRKVLAADPRHALTQRDQRLLAKKREEEAQRKAGLGGKLKRLLGIK